MGATAARPTCLVDKVKFALQAVGCLRGEAVLLDGRLNHADNLFEALPSWCQGGAVASQAELDLLDHVGSPEFLRLGRLSPEQHEQEQVGEAVEGGVCEVRGIHPVEVVDIVAAHEEEQGASKELQCVPSSIKVPDGGRMAWWNHR